VVTVSEQLNQKGILEDVGGVTYLTQLAGSVPTTANTIYYCDLVKSKALRRRGIEAAKNIRYLSEVQEFEYDETFLTEVRKSGFKNPINGVLITRIYIGKLLENVHQVLIRIKPIFFGCFYNTISHSTSLRSFRSVCKNPVFPFRT
jgi:hypothetical protein